MPTMEAEKTLVNQWHMLLSSYNVVASHLERELQELHGLSLSDFETLDRLTSKDGEPCRMQHLAGDMYLSQSALSRTVARLEKGGLVERSLCQDDRRGVYVELTDAGRQRHTESSKTHLAVLAEHLT
jgi:DNA-binding MarR family transcriptional regulator